MWGTVELAFKILLNMLFCSIFIDAPVKHYEHRKLSRTVFDPLWQWLPIRGMRLVLWEYAKKFNNGENIHITVYPLF